LDVSKEAQIVLFDVRSLGFLAGEIGLFNNQIGPFSISAKICIIVIQIKIFPDNVSFISPSIVLDDIHFHSQNEHISVDL